VATTEVTLTDRFPKGATAELSVYVGSAGSVVEPGGPSKTLTVGDDGKVTFKGCRVGAQFNVKVTSKDGGWSSHYIVQAKDETFSEDANLHRTGPEATGRRLQADREAQAEARREAEKTNPLVASPAPGRTVVQNRPARGRGPLGEPQPGPRQDQTRGPQRSDTPDGLGVPKDPKEHVPDVPQEAVGKNTPQRSSTETGTAAVKDLSEQVPGLRQEDVTRKPQRSDTPHGTAEPKPPVKGVQKRDDSSANRARGRTKTKAEENVAKRPKKKTTKTGTAKRAKTRR
jgi:hypothetical protein